VRALGRRPFVPVGLGELDLRAGRSTGLPFAGPVRLLVRDGDHVLGELNLAAGEALDPHDVLLTARASFHDGIWYGPVVEDDVPRHTADDVSVVVCTRDRPELLIDCLAAIRRCDPPPGEVIVVDSASTTDQTRTVALDAGVLYERVERRGLDRARNRGWQSASRPIVLYVDDDARIDHRAVQVAADTMLDPDVALVTGMILPAELETEAQRRFEHDNGMSLGFRRQIRNERVNPAGLRVWTVGVGALMAIRRDTLAELGGFDPLLDVGTATRGAGDLDIFHRILASGATVIYEPSCFARHLHRRDFSGWWRQLTGYGYGFTALVEKQRIDGRITSRQARRELLVWHVRRRGLQLARALLHGDVDSGMELIAEGYGSLFGGRAYREELATNAEELAAHRNTRVATPVDRAAPPVASARRGAGAAHRRPAGS
jgi:glycosyltransferase involved in cell wall biosynthesis